MGRAVAGAAPVPRRGYQPQQSVLKRHCGQRHTACMRYISAPHRSQSVRSGATGAGRSRSADTTGVIRAGFWAGRSATRRL